jgi:hypothetical protein
MKNLSQHGESEALPNFSLIFVQINPGALNVQLYWE